MDFLKSLFLHHLQILSVSFSAIKSLFHHSSMDYFNSLLPVEIASDILARLPTESVLDSKLVCTRWRYIVSNHPSFFKLQFHHSSSTAAAAMGSSCKLGFLALTVDDRDFRFQSKFHYFEYSKEESITPIQRIRRVNLVSRVWLPTIAGSHNGLICVVKSTDNTDIYICNPITRECVFLPKINGVWHEYSYSWRWTSGFGYVSSTNEYKVVVIFEFYILTTTTTTTAKLEEVYVYTLGSGSGWRNLGDFHFEFYCYWDEPGIFADGALYWMMDDSYKMILTFDLAEENFHAHLLPPPLPADNIWLKNRIGVLDGILFFSISLHGEGDDQLDEIWLLKNKKESFRWTKEFTIRRCKNLGIINMDAVLTRNRDGVLTASTRALTICNTKTLTSKSVVKFRDCFLKVIPHRNTFVSLKELGEEDTRVMESVEVEETQNREQLQDNHLGPEYIYL